MSILVQLDDPDPLDAPLDLNSGQTGSPVRLQGKNEKEKSAVKFVEKAQSLPGRTAGSPDLKTEKGVMRGQGRGGQFVHQSVQADAPLPGKAL